MPEVTPRDLYEWERHPATRAYLTLLQWEWYDRLRSARDGEELAFAHGIEHAIEMQHVLREKVLKDEEGEDIDDGNQSETDGTAGHLG